MAPVFRRHRHPLPDQEDPGEGHHAGEAGCGRDPPGQCPLGQPGCEEPGAGGLHEGKDQQNQEPGAQRPELTGSDCTDLGFCRSILVFLSSLPISLFVHLSLT